MYSDTPLFLKMPPCHFYSIKIVTTAAYCLAGTRVVELGCVDDGAISQRRYM